jgi:hypothetical protein
MKRDFHMRQRAGMAMVPALVLASLVACGGGSGEGVVGSGGTGIVSGMAIGTVNGFGSVIVDGVSFDNRNAPVVREIAPGQDVVAEVKLGDRVAVQYEHVGVASEVRVDAALEGTVSASMSEGRFSMLGQTVTANVSSASGPVTQFGGGYTQASDVRAGHEVEVHGVIVRQGEAYSIQATRIDKLASASAYLRVTGLVSQWAASGAKTLNLGALTVDTSGAKVLPAGTALANGQAVTVLAMPSTLTQPGAGAWRVQAAQVRVRELRGGDLDDYVSGSVSHLEVQAKTLMLGSQVVSYATAEVIPAATMLANGQYVVMRGRAGSDGVLVAASLTIRDASSDREAELRGNILGYDSVTGGFLVRDVTVDASTATLEHCPASGLADGLFVEIGGALDSVGVVARKVECKDEPTDASVEREGRASAVDLAGKTFLLAPEHGDSISVKWTATTYFGGLTPQTLNGAKVQVEGVLSGATLTASKIKGGD